MSSCRLTRSASLRGPGRYARSLEAARAQYLHLDPQFFQQLVQVGDGGDDPDGTGDRGRGGHDLGAGGQQVIAPAGGHPAHGAHHRLDLGGAGHFHVHLLGSGGAAAPGVHADDDGLDRVVASQADEGLVENRG